MYLHEMAEQEASFTKEEMQAGKHTEYEKRLIQHYLDIIASEREKERQLLQQQQQLTIQTNGSKPTQQQRPYSTTTTGSRISNSPPIEQHFRKSSNELGQNSNGEISIDNDNSDQMVSVQNDRFIDNDLVKERKKKSFNHYYNDGQIRYSSRVFYRRPQQQQQNDRISLSKRSSLMSLAGNSYQNDRNRYSYYVKPEKSFNQND